MRNKKLFLCGVILCFLLSACGTADKTENKNEMSQQMSEPDIISEEVSEKEDIFDGKTDEQDNANNDSIIEDYNISGEEENTVGGEIHQESDYYNSLVGKQIKLGEYNGHNTWRVLEVNNDKALIISEYCLEARAFHDAYEEVTWESSAVREWLNDTYYNIAFNDNEKDVISSTVIFSEDNPIYGTSGGNNTSDKIFLLSINQVHKYFANEKASMATYGKEYDNMEACWLVRNPGNSSTSICYVGKNGEIDTFGRNVCDVSVSVRPAMWISLYNPGIVFEQQNNTGVQKPINDAPNTGYEAAMRDLSYVIKTGDIDLAKCISAEYYIYHTLDNQGDEEYWSYADKLLGFELYNSEDEKLREALLNYKSADCYVFDDNLDENSRNALYNEVAGEYFDKIYSRFDIQSMVQYSFTQYTNKDGNYPIVLLYKIDDMWLVNYYMGQGIRDL